MKAFYTLILTLLACSAFAQSKLPPCEGDDYEQWSSCTGTIENDDGSGYEGDFADGQINGYGLLTLVTGEKILGKFTNSVLSGRGLLVTKDGSRYAGEFDQNTFNGLGILVPANGERIEGIFRNGQFVEPKKVIDPQILALLTAAPNLASVVVLGGYSSSELIEIERKAAKLAEERLRVAKERERLDAEELQRQQAQQREQEEKLKIAETQRLENERKAAKLEEERLRLEMKTYTAGKVYYFINGLGSVKGTCVSKKWGEGFTRNVSEGIPYWGIALYERFADSKREPGFFAYKNMEEGFFFGTIFRGPITLEKVRADDWQHCSYLIATGDELNALPALNRELNKTKSEFKLKHELTFAEAEKEWLNARGFKSLADYSNAATINWQIAGARYASLSKYGVTNKEQFDLAYQRKDAIKCDDGYPRNLQGLEDFLTDEAAASRAKKPIDSYCAQRADVAKQEINKEAAEFRRRELASPLLNCTKVNCANSAEVESAVRDSWMRLKGKNSPYANNCFDAIKLVKELRSAGRVFGPDTVTTAFIMCNMGLKELR